MGTRSEASEEGTSSACGSVASTLTPPSFLMLTVSNGKPGSKAKRREGVIPPGYQMFSKYFDQVARQFW